MEKLTKINAKMWALRIAVLVVSLFGVGAGVKAYSNYYSTQPTVVAESGSTVVVTQNNQAQPAQPEAQGNLGAVTSPFLPGPEICVNGDCTYSLVGNIRASTTVAFADPFLSPTTTAGGVVITDIVNGFGYTAATATVEVVRIVAVTTTAPTTTYEVDCSASSNSGTTSTAAIINTEGTVAANTSGSIESGMSSSTNPGAGSLVLSATTEADGIHSVVRKILLTPTQPYLVCKVWQPTGGSLDTFTGTANVGTLKVLVRISRPT